MPSPIRPLWFTLAEYLADVSDFYWDGLLLRARQNNDDETGDPEVDQVIEHAEELFDEIRARRLEISTDAREIFQLLGEIPITLKWHDGLRRDLVRLIHRAVEEAERFGDGTGEKKRQFAIDMVVRVLRRYNQSGIYLIPPIENAFVVPFVGVIVDWSVEVLNLHNAWPPVKKVAFPSIFQGSYGWLVKLGVGVFRFVTRLRELFFFPSKYERNLRDAMANAEPDIQVLLNDMPPERMREAVTEVVNILVEVGHETVPYLHIVDLLLRLSFEISDLTMEERREAAFIILRRLLREAFADDALALAFIDSYFGYLLIQAMVQSTEWILERNGLLPEAEPVEV